MSTPRDPTSPHVVIVGAGFAGLAAARVLAAKDLRLTVVDRTNHHLFQPLLYQVASAGLSPADIAMPVRAVLSARPNVRVVMGAVTRLDPTARTVTTADGEEIAYDRLIVATGARHSYFAHPEWEALAPGLKTLEDATEIRRRILLAFETAEREADAAKRDALMTFTIVGGGPTGIELAGAVAELSHFALAKDFQRINPAQARVVLIEAGPQLLPSFEASLGPKAQKALERLGVVVRLGARVDGIDPTGVTLASGERLHSYTTIWAAGVAPSELAKDLAAVGAPLDRAGRVLVTPELTVPGFPEIAVIGDLAAVPWKDGAFVPGMAPGAMQMGRHAARNILRAASGKPTEPFHYLHKGMMATIGRAAAVVDFAGMRLSGLVAWLIWLGIHIVYLIGYRNRMLVLMQWAWSYLTFQRGTRLITTPWRPLGAGSGGASAKRP
jgi:NADH dehydrogenase